MVAYSGILLWLNALILLCIISCNRLCGEFFYAGKREIALDTRNDFKLRQ